MPRLTPTRRFESNTGARIYRVACDALPGISGRVHLILGAGPPTLVDTGSGEPHCTEQIVAALESIASQFGEDFGLRQIERILITHAHIDHIGGVADLVTLTGASIGVHPLDSPVVTSWDDRAALFNRRLRSFLHRAGVPKERHPAMIEAFGFVEGRVRSVPVDFSLDENDSPEGVRVVHTPGHSPGHVCIQVGDILLCGDHILARTIPQQWPESLAASTGLARYLESLGRILRLDGISVALGGHEPPISALPHRIEEILAAQRRRLQRVVDVAATSSPPASIAEIARRIYARQQGFSELLALIDVGSRIEYLEKRGSLETANLDEVRRDRLAPIRYRPTDPSSKMTAPQGNTA
jgi:glyoxylase-like metal-dependent hydrolase (beta-lactamase superfamily II)